jgi:signal transduction histidine kinase
MRKNRLRLITAILFITLYMLSALVWWAFALTRNQGIIYQKELSLLEVKRDWALDFAYHFSRSEASKTTQNKALISFGAEQIYVDTSELKRAVREKFPEIHVYLMTLRQHYPLELCLITDTNLKKSLEQTRNSKKRAWILEGLTLGLITLLIAAAMFFYVDKIIRLNAQQNNFLLAVTHELKTPISATKLAIQTLQRNDAPTLVPKLMDMANSNILRLSRMVDQILLATKFESKFTDPVYATVLLSVLFEHAIKGLELPPEKRSLITLVHEEEIEFEADENMMVIVIRNLITNALKYGLDQPVEIKTEKFKLGFKIEVSDCGIGISDSDKKRIFEKFYRVGEEKTRTQPGSGLGLYLVKNITEIHSGKVTVTDNTPNGTKFTLTFNQSQPLA